MSSSHADLNYLKLDWSASIDLESSSMFTALIHQKIAPDIILGADVVCAIPFLCEISIQLLNQAFDPSVIPALVGTLKIALQTYTGAPCKQPKVALIALTVRNKDTFEQFLNHTRGILILFLKVECPIFTKTNLRSCPSSRRSGVGVPYAIFS